ncbi:hypothetical protein TIFTF001_029030 [Ficus carica]|uniref:Uncharacterized protein n=1 Tax=Ficus carica TaxID=3494 RepID=A0AA88J1W4_FICCA|nr:hypothetical protein TIFTF001_029030 [Ficus carica]
MGRDLPFEPVRRNDLGDLFEYGFRHIVGVVRINFCWILCLLADPVIDRDEQILLQFVMHRSRGKSLGKLPSRSVPDSK